MISFGRVTLSAGGCALLLVGCAADDALRAGASLPPAHPAPSAIASPTRLSVDSPVERICADPAGKTVLDRDLPGLSTHPDFSMFKSMSLKSLAGMSDGKITPDMLAKVQADLSALKPAN